MPLIGLEYAAGLFEGEGYITVDYGPSNRRPHPCVGVNMADREPLERFAQTLGLYVRGPYAQKTPSGLPAKGQYRVRARGLEVAQQIIIYLWPYLSPRRKARAREVLQLCR